MIMTRKKEALRKNFSVDLTLLDYTNVLNILILFEMKSLKIMKD